MARGMFGYNGSFDFPLVKRTLSVGVINNAPYGRFDKTPKYSENEQHLNDLASRVYFEAFRKASGDSAQMTEYWRVFKKTLTICEQRLYNPNWRAALVEDISGTQRRLEDLLDGTKEKTVYKLAETLAYVPEIDPVLRAVDIGSRPRGRGRRARGIHDGLVIMSAGSASMYSGLRESKFIAGPIKIYTETNRQGKQVNAIVNPEIVNHPNQGLQEHLKIGMNSRTAAEIFGQAFPAGTRTMLEYRFSN